jgi:hypothetical protein
MVYLRLKNVLSFVPIKIIFLLKHIKTMKIILVFLSLIFIFSEGKSQFTQATPGNVQATTLGLGGNKPVFADNTGTLVKGAGSFYRTIPAADFDVTTVSATAGNYTGGMKFFVGGEMYSTGTTKLIAPIYLPLNTDQSNIKINSMTLCVVDNSVTSDLLLTAYEVNSSIGSAPLIVNTIGSVQSTLNNANHRCFKTNSSMSYPIDSKNNSYYVEISPKQGQGGTGGNFWDSTFSNLMLVHVILEYSYN